MGILSATVSSEQQPSIIMSAVVKALALLLALVAVAYCQEEAEALTTEAEDATKEKFGYYGYGGHLAHHGYGNGHLGYAAHHAYGYGYPHYGYAGHHAGYGYAHPGYYGHAYGYGHGYTRPYYWKNSEASNTEAQQN